MILNTLYKCLLISIITVSIPACVNNKAALTQPQVEAIIADLTKAEEYVNLYVLKDTTKQRKAELFKYYNMVFNIHRTTSKLFMQSMYTYMGTPTGTRDIFDSISTQLRKLPLTTLPTAPIQPIKAN